MRIRNASRFAAWMARSGLAVFLGLACLSQAQAQPALMTCQQFKAMSRPQQTIFVGGIRQGLQAALAVTEAFAGDFEAKAATASEKASLARAAAASGSFLNRSPFASDLEAVTAIVAKCPQGQYVGLAYVDLISGR
jgi:hypothetical protein